MDAPAYSERLGVPLRRWVQGTMLVASLWLACIVAVPEPVAWSVAGVAMALLVAGLVTFGSARLEVSAEGFRAGRARIEGHHLGPAESLDAESTRRVAGREADVRAFLLLRPYLKRAVRVEITDPAPYWLVSSRRPDELAAALNGLTDSAP